MIEHRAFFGDGEKAFALPTPMLEELQRTTGHGIGKLFDRLRGHDFSLQDIAETIRLALIGGGTSPKEAAALVKTYVNERPLAEGFELASIVLGVRFFGNATVSDKPQGETGHVATTHPDATFHVEKQPDGSTMGYFA